MKPKIELDSAAGETFVGSAFAFGDELVLLVFGAGVVVLRADSGYEPGDETIEESHFDPLNFRADDLVRLGVATQPELDALVAERAAKQAEARAAEERREFERLKAKYEGAAPCQ